MFFVKSGILLMGLQGVKLSVADLAAIGVKRISVGSGLARCANKAHLPSRMTR
jgi:2-methylisocitrate lyase-like PEP mutase family enzyme